MSDHKIELIKAIQDLADELGRTPHLAELVAQTPYYWEEYKEAFGSWNAAVKIAGYEPNQSGTSRIPKEVLLDDLRELADELGRTPTCKEMQSHGKHSKKTYIRRFESWNNALKEAGLERNRHSELTEEMIAEDIRRVADDLGHTPTTAEYNEHGTHTAYRITRNHFPSWWLAVKLAGCDPSQVQRPETNHLLEILQILALELDRSPTGEDIEVHTPYPASLYREKFGTIRRAQYVAGVHDDLAILDGDELPPADLEKAAETEAIDG